MRPEWGQAPRTVEPCTLYPPNGTFGNAWILELFFARAESIFVNSRAQAAESFIAEWGPFVRADRSSR
jgi:hypothetical protein